MLSKKELGKFRDAREELHKKDEPYRRAANSDFIIYLLTLMAVAIFIRTFIFEPVQCIGISMYPTLVGWEGMFTEKLTYTVSAPQRDDIIICRYPYHTEKCVKRVIAVPGDRISISDGAHIPQRRKAGRERLLGRLYRGQRNAGGHGSGKEPFRGGRQPQPQRRQPPCGLHTLLAGKGKGARRNDAILAGTLDLIESNAKETKALSRFLLYALLLEIYSNLMVKGNCKRVVQGYIILN